MTALPLSPEQAAVFEAIETTREHIFVTGRAGTGKSTLLNHLSWNTSKQLVIAAPTGVAALNVGGQTIHSLFRLPIGVIADQDIEQSAGAAQTAQHHRHPGDRRGVDGQRRPARRHRPEPAPGSAAQKRGVRRRAGRAVRRPVPAGPGAGRRRRARLLPSTSTGRCGSSTRRSGTKPNCSSTSSPRSTGSMRRRSSSC